MTKAVCADAERMINQLATFTRTQCIATPGKNGGVAFVVVSDESVLSTPELRRGWLLVTMGAFGKLLNERPELKVDELYLSDAPRIKRQRAFTLPLASVKAWQSSLHAGTVELGPVYADLEKTLAAKNLPGR